MKLTDAITQSGVSAIVYGESGIGKTHFIGSLPGKTLIIAAEKGGIKTLDKFPADVKARLDVVYLPQQTADIEETSRLLNAFFDRLIIEENDFDNIVLDSATELANGILMAKTDPNKNGGSPTQKNYADTISAMKRYLRILRDIAELKSKNIIITALEAEVVLAQNSDGSASTKTHPALCGKKLPPEAEGLFDIVAHLQKKADGTRYFLLEGSDVFVGKDRFGRKYCKADGEILLSGKVGNEENKKEK